VRTNPNLDGAMGIITASGEAYRFFVAPVRDTVANTTLLVILSRPEAVMTINTEEIIFKKKE